MTELYQKVIELYAEFGSVEAVAQRLKGQASKVTIQRILISEGLWSSKTSRLVAGHLAQGKTVKQIAEELHIGEKAVQQYMPYTRERSSDTASARTSKEYRERKRQIASGQVHHVKRKEENMEKEIFWPPEITYRLRLELVSNLSKKNEEVLHTLGKVNNVLSRDVVVPESMTLHALHYVIQRAFGWQNSHLHHFSIGSDREKLKGLCSNSFLKWAELCGIYFRFPYSDEDMSDIYWDEDYDESQGFRMWLRKKYTGPYRYLGRSEHYAVAQQRAQYFCEENRLMRVGPTFQEYQAGKRDAKMIRIQELSLGEADDYFEYQLGELLERLRIDEVLSMRGEVEDPFRVAHAAKDLLSDAIEQYNEINGSLTEATDKLMRIQELERGRVSPANRQIIRALEAENPERQAAKAIQDIQRLGEKTNPRSKPITDALFYSYDYGDGWVVKITCKNVYTLKTQWTRQEEAGYKWITGPIESKKIFQDYTVEDREGRAIEDTERDLIVRANMKRTAKCLKADGLPLMDDVGGLNGFCDFLQRIRSDDLKEKEENLAWAKSMGWTGRIGKVENIL